MINLKLKMKNLIPFSLLLFLSACSTNKSDNKSTQENKKGNFVFENSTTKNDSLNDVKSSKIKMEHSELKDETKMSGNKSKNIKDNIKLKKKSFSDAKNDEPVKKSTVQKQEPVQIPKEWVNAYSSDPKWLELYNETSDAFLNGWTNEFLKNPDARISKDELLYAYRRRMEKIFYETPSFIEFSCSELSKSEKFREFILKFNIR
jgi:hypothetical protein